MTDKHTIPTIDTQLEVAARALIDRGPLTTADVDELVSCVRRHQALALWRGLGGVRDYARQVTYAPAE